MNKSINWYLVDSALTKAAITYPLSDNLATLQKTAAFPGAVLLVGQAGEVVYHKAFGCRSVLPEPSGMAADMIFDIASLTKALITTTIAMRLVEQGKLRLEDKIAKIFPKFEAHGKEEMSVLNLLTHTSGYAATAPFYKFINNNTALSNRAAIDIVYNEVFRTKLENMCGRVTKYSDIGFILLGHVLEEVSGLTLDKLAVKHVIAPLQLAHTGYIDLRNSQLAPNSDIIVPTAKCPWRQRILCAEVHDDNAWAMGGIAAHSGIFSNALDLHQFAFEMIECYHGRGGLINKEVMK
ncbi:MAG: beta-lactamase family protein [Proteobacteria bacterium]|nr:beta-lactamase family protein [Pseudomonadota bacterium]